MEAEGAADIEPAAVSGNSSPKTGLSDSKTGQHKAESNNTLGQYRVIRRNGKVTAFDLSKISVAMTKAFINVEGGTAAASTRIHRTVEALSEQVLGALTRRMPDGGTVHIEDIQDQVELALMRAGEQKIARAYVIYREERSRERKAVAAATPATPQELHSTPVSVTLGDGSKAPLDVIRLRSVVVEACEGIAEVDSHTILEDTLKNLFDGVDEDDVNHALVMSARTLIEKEPNYTYVAASLRSLSNNKQAAT